MRFKRPCSRHRAELLPLNLPCAAGCHLDYCILVHRLSRAEENANVNHGLSCGRESEYKFTSPHGLLGTHLAASP